MKDATKFAVGVMAIWFAGILFFVAFHPGGLIMPSGSPARNPSDVFKYYLALARGGVGKSDSGGSGGSS